MEVPVPDAGETAIVVPVPAAESVVGPYRLRYDPSAARGMPAHVTLHYPFLPQHLLTAEGCACLRRFAASEAAFPFELTELRTFGSGRNDALYLVPRPEEPFLRLADLITARWPEVPLYGGLYDRIIPHLTVAMLDASTPVHLLRRDLEPRLPIRARADEIWLVGRRGEGTWSTVDRFELGPGGGGAQP